MITSKYFNDIKDFINLEIGIKRFQGNMKRFHFNPIPLNEYSRKFFPNIETFHVYNRGDEIFKDGKIFKKVIWYTVNYSTYIQEKEQGNICKNIEYTKEDRKSYGNTIPSEVKSLGYECFYECSSLTTINIPSSISKLGSCCFKYCSSLKSINLPLSITSFGTNCFYECSSLTSMNIDNIQFISKEKIFMNEPVLISIEIPDNLQTINGKNIEKKDINEFIILSSISELGYCCFYECSLLTSINIPSSIKEIGDYCFYKCSSLKSINLPLSITSFGNYCFYKCYSLTSMNIENLQFISEERIFMNEPVLISIKIPYTIQIINGKNIFKKDINEFIIPSSISELGFSCFKECLSLISINIPSSIKEIGWSCFYECSSLTSINIPSSVISIGDGCFYGCTSLKSINIPSSVSKIGDNFFEGCYSLTSINIPSSITSFGDWCFNTCSSLQSINIPSSISEIGTCCFYKCSSLTSINIPSSITSFGSGCFYKCGCKEELMKNKTIPRNCFNKW
ncbi:hypothetical protein, conserved [Entamoeba dispar SAW760]|uniref:Leucine rich repeat containing protein BspA family protein n=1 Tax=Entamoeba dispar (strain ATCC PRA-260 / SAW760) TaxID=370354 RepID=B0EHI0_ENTDS|nr:uncharacterized protein EDI_064430 [Entamoeba dispar SAW760]EDR26016.1 hypothetical protein, conserved [Entamoeba dispar SAW760]|eukprot:EDR26016.1 hypothetical protein, conserved [Entamoeba dispar SAW760]